MSVTLLIAFGLIALSSVLRLVLFFTDIKNRNSESV